MNYLVTGTDTGVGKTYLTSGLVRSLRRAGHSAAGLKPFCSGDWADIEALMAANEQAVPSHVINSVWFRAPLAPYAAALVESRMFDLTAARANFGAMQSQFSPILVEGAGGLLVPILRDYDFGHLAADWGLNLVIVAANRLGMLNHCCLTVEVAQRRGLPIAAIVLNELDAETDLARQTNPAVLEDVLQRPVIRLEHGATEFDPLIKRIGLS